MTMTGWWCPERRSRWSLLQGMAAIGILLAMSINGAPGLAAQGETLIVVTRKSDSDVSQAFADTFLPPIADLAAQMGIGLVRYPVDAQVPPDVALTPLLVFQNHRGRSTFQGRYTALGRIRTFLRTARHIPQSSVANRRKDIAVWRSGRVTIWAPIKISAVTGSLPPGHDAEAFQAEARAAILDGFSRFEVAPEASLGRSDRGFYMDFYPWRAADGTLFLSLALYSQFDCKTPIYTRKKPALIGPWSQRETLFREAAALMETAVAEAVVEPNQGDGFDPLGADLKVVSWEQLGFPLPPAPAKRARMADVPKTLPLNWRLRMPDSDAPPLIHFHFPAPLDQYRGEVTAAQGHFRLGKGGIIAGAEGAVHVDTRKAVTMGDPILDEAIQGQALLGARQYPEARFTLTSASGDGQPVRFGHLTPALLEGNFALKGKRVPLSLKAEVEPAIGTAGDLQLLVRTRFQIDLVRFAIEGADGPAPARNTLLFDLNLVFAKQPDS
ncbi:MAG: YceI family protein [Desulfosarcinaceae bacterium]|nr:YceI family protein [Desulfosarcinaceae bacterium]